MSEKEFEIYLSVLSQLLRLSPSQKAAISDEFQDHMEQRLISFLEAGLSRDDAIKQAMEEFGDVSGLAFNVTKASRSPALKVAIRSTVAASFAAVIIVIWVTFFTPEHRVAAPPTARAELILPLLASQNERILEAEPVLSFPLLSAYETKIQRALDTPTSIDFEDIPLDDALASIETQKDIEIWIDQVAASDLRIDTQTRITLKLTDIPLRSILKLLLNRFQLTYVNEDEVLKITAIASRHEPSTRVYAVGDLFETDEEATQLLESIECGLHRDGSVNEPRSLAISSRIGTLTARQPFGLQTQVMTLLRSYRDARRDSILPLVAPQDATNRFDRAEVMRSYPLPTVRESRIQRAVNATASGTWESQPLLAILNQIKTQHQFEIWIDEAALANEQVDTAIPDRRNFG